VSQEERRVSKPKTREKNAEEEGEEEKWS